MSIPNAISSENTSQPDVIIVGAGLSGLTSAVKILEKEPSLHIKIIEASSSIGGQIANTKLGEIGGKWITEDQYHVYTLMKELGIPMRRRTIAPGNLSRCWELDGGLTAVLVKHELERYIDELNLTSQYFRPGQHNPYREKGSMKSHINRRLHFSKGKKFMGDLVLLFCGADAADITYNEFMNICWSCGGLKMLMDLYIDCPDTLWEIASTNLFNVFQLKLANVDIILRRKVIEIRHFRDSVELLDSEKDLHKAEVIILAIPKNAIEDIKITPTMPMELRKPPPPLDRTKYVMTSFLAKYLDNHWRLAGFNGNLLLNEPFLVIGHEYRPTIYGGMIVHEEGIEPLVRQIILSTLSKQYGDEMFLPLEYFQRTFDLSTMTSMPSTSPWNRVVWSSSALSATCYRGRLSGAVQSGLRAAMNALFILRPQTVGWQDIAEVQRTTSSLVSPQATRLSVWLSSWNIFNLGSYGVFFLGVAAVFGFVYKNYI